MKNLVILIIATFLTFSMRLSAETTTTNNSCEWHCSYNYPQSGHSYEEGEDIYVKVDPKKYQDVEYMELYVNGHFVRKETEYPYEWCKGSGNSDSYLRDLKKGTYNLKCRVRTKCQEWYEYTCTFKVN